MGAWAYDSDANDAVYDALECFDFPERMELRVGDASIHFEFADDISDVVEKEEMQAMYEHTGVVVLMTKWGCKMPCDVLERTVEKLEAEPEICEERSHAVRFEAALLRRALESNGKLAKAVAPVTIRRAVERLPEDHEGGVNVLWPHDRYAVSREAPARE